MSRRHEGSQKRPIKKKEKVRDESDEDVDANDPNRDYEIGKVLEMAKYGYLKKRKWIDEFREQCDDHLFFHIHWEGYSSSQNSWEPYENVCETGPFLDFVSKKHYQNKIEKFKSHVCPPKASGEDEKTNDSSFWKRSVSTKKTSVHKCSVLSDEDFEESSVSVRPAISQEDSDYGNDEVENGRLDGETDDTKPLGTSCKKRSSEEAFDEVTSNKHQKRGNEEGATRKRHCNEELVLLQKREEALAEMRSKREYLKRREMQARYHQEAVMAVEKKEMLRRSLLSSQSRSRSVANVGDSDCPSTSSSASSYVVPSDARGSRCDGGKTPLKNENQYQDVIEFLLDH